MQYLIIHEHHVAKEAQEVIATNLISDIFNAKCRVDIIRYDHVLDKYPVIKSAEELIGYLGLTEGQYILFEH